jgi:hypothetical protein
MSIKGKFVKTIVVNDDDVKDEFGNGVLVEISIFKLETGGMIGVDESFLANTDEPVYSPYDNGVELNLDL